MSLFKCKMCGGSLEISTDQKTAVCEYCGTRQTLPRLSSDRKTNLYDRASHFRRANEFDKAMGIYESILEEDTSDCEAYWSLVLCRYGIEYVEDPVSHKRVPTVNRAQFTSIFDDEDYKSAIKYADSTQRAIYEEEARVINEIQKGILAVSRQEEPFDVFICYKETDKNGERTPDSVFATDLYYQLTREGFKVFFARITLEDKLGTAYEPYIFAALNSAKVMVVLGTCPENFNAVWVKNEWSRYLQLVKQSHGEKVLIPAYRGMDPYDLPDEFSHLQAQDMSKLGFMQDLVRGIRKITGKDQIPMAVPMQGGIPTAIPMAAPMQQSGLTAEKYLQRVRLFLEDEDWNNAWDYCERALDLDPTNAQAYLGQLLVRMKLPRREALANCPHAFTGLDEYKKILRFGDDALKNEMEGYLQARTRRMEEMEKENTYSRAEAMASAGTSEGYQEAAKLMKGIQDYRDAAQKAARYYDAAGAMLYARAEGLITRQADEPTYRKAAALMESIRDYRDAGEKAAQYAETANQMVYMKAETIASRLADPGNYKEAARLMGTISGYRDAAQKQEEYLTGAKELVYQKALQCIGKKYNETDYKRAINTMSTLGDYKDAPQKVQEFTQRIEAEHAAAIRREKRKKKAVLWGILGLIGAAILGVGIYFLIQTTVIEPGHYKEGQVLLEAGDLRGALTEFDAAGNCKDSVEQAAALRPQFVRHCVLNVNTYGIGAIREDGSVLTTNPENTDMAADWTDAVSMLGHCTALNTEGKILGVSEDSDLHQWQDVLYVYGSRFNNFGVKTDGTVLPSGYNDRGECKVDNWTGIIEVASGEDHTLGLRSDGTVVATGESNNGTISDMTGCENVVALYASDYRSAALHADGSVTASGGEAFLDTVNLWTGMIDLAVSDAHVVGLRADGTVAAVGNNDKGQCEVGEWTDIVAVGANDTLTVGLKSNGTLVFAGEAEAFDVNQVKSWKNIRIPERIIAEK